MTESLTDRIARFGAAMRPTPLLRLDHELVDLYVKLESSNPTGSAKDRSAFAILHEAAHAGLIAPGATVVESSSGNFAVSLAMLCRALGVHFVPPRQERRRRPGSGRRHVRPVPTTMVRMAEFVCIPARLSPSSVA